MIFKQAIALPFQVVALTFGLVVACFVIIGLKATGEIE